MVADHRQRIAQLVDEVAPLHLDGRVDDTVAAGLIHVIDLLQGAGAPVGTGLPGEGLAAGVIQDPGVGRPREEGTEE